MHIRFLLLSIIVLGINSFSVGAYFEDKYFCLVQQNSIQVAIEQSVGYQKCLIMIENISGSLSTITTQIKVIDAYIQYRVDIAYRSRIRLEFLQKKQSLEFLKSQIIASMDSFETDFFLRIKKIVVFGLQSDKRNFETRLNQINSIINIVPGDTLLILQQEKSRIQEKLKNIQTMSTSFSFEVFIPALRLYFYDSK